MGHHTLVWPALCAEDADRAPGQSWGQPMGSTVNDNGPQALSVASLGGGGVLGKPGLVSTL